MARTDMTLRFQDAGLDSVFEESMKRLKTLDAAADSIAEPQDVPAEEGYSWAKKAEIYEKMLDDVKRRRSMNKSIWTDEPVIPVRKSIWFDDENEQQSVEAQQSNEIADVSQEESSKPAQHEETAPAPKKKAEKGMRKTLVVNITDKKGRSLKNAKIVEVSDSGKPVEVFGVSVIK